MLLSQDTESESKQRPISLIEDYNYIQSLYPRIEGSEAERNLLSYIEKRLTDIDVSYRGFDFLEYDMGHSFSSCLEATVEGDLPDTLILAVPLNHPPDTPEGYDGSINIALAINVLEQIKKEKPPITVKVLFLGAEFGGDPDYPMGSRLFLRDFYPEYRVAVLYLNLKTIPSRLHIRSGGKGIGAPYWLIDRCTISLKETDLFFLLRGNENQIFRTGLTSEKMIFEPFLSAGYPALSLEGEYNDPADGESENWMFSFNPFFQRFITTFKGGIPETWDRHYLFFQIRDFYFSISEKSYIIIFFSLLSLTLLYSLVYSYRLKKYLRTIFRNFLSLPAFFISSFILLFISTLTLEGILYIRNIIDLWTVFPLLFFLFKLILPFLFLLIFSGVLKKIPLSRNGSFYSASAILFLILDILVLALINISFTYYFLWAFVFALLFSATKNKILKTIFFLVSPYWIIKTIVELFMLPRLEFCHVLLFSKIWGNLFLALMCLPFILMFIRLKMILPPIRRVGKQIRFKIGVSFISLTLGILLCLFLIYSPYNKQNKQPVHAHYIINRTTSRNSLNLKSPASLGKLKVWDTENLIAIDSRSRSYNLPLPVIPELIEISISSVEFLDRKNIDLNFILGGRPFKLRLTLSSTQEFILFDSNFPYHRQSGGRQYDLLIGVNPPLPIPVQLTIPRDMTFNLVIELDYLDTPNGFHIYAEDKKIDTLFTVKKTLEFKT